MKKPIVVIKIGGKSLYASEKIWSDISQLSKKSGFGVLMVVGGSKGLSNAYATLGLEEKKVELANGDFVRFCPPEEMLLIHNIYQNKILPYVHTNLSTFKLKNLCSTAFDLRFVIGKKYPALKINNDGRTMLERRSMSGEIISVAKKELQHLLDVYDVVVLSSPIATTDNQLLNVDADMLAAHIAVTLEAEHVLFCTSTHGILRDPLQFLSNIPDIYFPDPEIQKLIKGRMKQKARAVQHILNHSSASVRIVSEKSSFFSTPSNMQTRCWRFGGVSGHESLLTSLVQVSSRSCYEREAVDFLYSEMQKRGFQSFIDPVGNAVGRIGSGAHKLLLLGHIDTVPGPVPLQLSQDILYGRGSVDAKASLCCFVEAAAQVASVIHQTDVEVCIVGAVEEEISTSRGAFYVRDNFVADAVIIGEPSGAGALTLGYRGLIKARVISQQPHMHSASSAYRSATDQIICFLEEVKQYLKNMATILYSTRNINTHFAQNDEIAIGEFNLRLPSTEDFSSIVVWLKNRAATHNLNLEILRQTPGFLEPKNSKLVNLFRRVALRSGNNIRLLNKTGTSDMNTLATTWKVPMVAYGPGNSSLDHTGNEHIFLKEYRAAVDLLSLVIKEWALEVAYEHKKISA